jgi:hypothetical protein
MGAVAVPAPVPLGVLVALSSPVDVPVTTAPTPQVGTSALQAVAIALRAEYSVELPGKFDSI